MNISRSISSAILIACCAMAPWAQAIKFANDTGKGLDKDDSVRSTGTVQTIYSPSSFNVNGVRYELATQNVRLHDETGKLATQISPAIGTQIMFISTKKASKQQITELWVVKK